eukprot:459829-Prymnesium_polylepis.1
MSGRTATWRQPVHSTFFLTVNDRVGPLASDQDSRLRLCALARATIVSRAAKRHSQACGRSLVPTETLAGGPALYGTRTSRPPYPLGHARLAFLSAARRVSRDSTAVPVPQLMKEGSPVSHTNHPGVLLTNVSITLGISIT